MRSRRGWAWIDEVDAPLGETREQYRVTIAGSAASAEFASGEPQLAIPAADFAPLGSGAATIEIRLIGDWAASRPAELSVILP